MIKINKNSKKTKKKPVSKSALDLTRISFRSSRSTAAMTGMPHEFPTCQALISEVGLRPSATHTLDRKNNYQGYIKGNLRWSTKSEQSQNRSITKRITFDGKTWSAWDFSQHLNVSVHSVYRALNRGESPEQIAFHAREASASKTIPQPWPWPEDRTADWERAYLHKGRHGQSRESFLYEEAKANLQRKNATMRRYAEAYIGPQHPDDDEPFPTPEEQEASARYQRALRLFWYAKEKYEQAIARRKAGDDLNLFD